MPIKSDKEIKVSKKSKKTKRNSEIPENTENELTDTSKEKKKKKKKPVNNSESDFDENDPELVKWCDEGDSDLESKTKYKELKSQLKAVLNVSKVTKAEKQNVGKPKNNAVESLDESFKIESVECEENSAVKRKREQSNDPVENVDCDEHSSKKKKKKRKEKQSNNVEDLPQDSVGSEKKKKPNEKQSNIQNLPINGAGSENKKSKKDNNKSAKNFQDENFERNKQKNKKKLNGEPYSRRKPLNTERNIIIINGEELEITSYDGFPILATDAERLTQLRKSLISKGIARSEVNRTMKLERRKCEKALSRIKKKMCYNCRKGGHNLSECPELNKSDSVAMPSSGLCFKCGSTEHTHFACKVVKTQEYKFAQCFICNEQVTFYIIKYIKINQGFLNYGS